jgi:hypothetical protein
MAWKGFPGSSTIDIGFAAARPHSTALIGVGDGAHAEDQLIDIRTIAVADRPMLPQSLADDATIRVPL